MTFLGISLCGLRSDIRIIAAVAFDIVMVAFVFAVDNFYVQAKQALCYPAVEPAMSSTATVNFLFTLGLAVFNIVLMCCKGDSKDKEESG